MAALVVSDDEWAAQQLRQGLIQQGYECPPGHVVAAELATAFLGQPDVELVVVVLPPDVERLLALVAEARGRTKVPVLAVGPTSDAKLVLRAMRSGASEYLDADDLEAELSDALRRCRQVDGAHRQGRVVAVFGPCGGTGASTVAANLAVALARQSGKSLLIDLKLATGDLSALLDLKPAFTLADLGQHASQLDRALFQRSLAAHASGAHLLAPPHAPADLEYLSRDVVQQSVALGRGLFPHTLIDLDRSYPDLTAPVLRSADRILLMLRLDFTCLRNAHRSLDYFTELGVARDRVRVVVNRQGQPREISAGKAEEALGVKIFHSIPDDPKVMIQANNNGEPALVGAPSARACRSLAQLAKALQADLAG